MPECRTIQSVLTSADPAQNAGNGRTPHAAHPWTLPESRRCTGGCLRRWLLAVQR